MLSRRSLLAGIGAFGAAGSAFASESDLHAQLGAARAPADYIISQFAAADVVLLGEDHCVRQNLAFVHALIPALYAAGVRTLCMEFGANEDQAALDALTSGARYDEGAARRIMFNYDVAWPFADYMELYRAAWRFNRTLPRRAPRFRVLNLSYHFDWTSYAGAMTPAAARRVFHRGPVDRYRADIIQREVLARGEKALALVGTPHAFTRYGLPSFDLNAADFTRTDHRNLGHLLYAAAPERTRCVLLHQAFWADDSYRRVQPGGGALEAALTRPAGFDLTGAAGALAERSVYGNGDPNFTLGQVADGYVFLAPLRELEGCTLDEAFVTAENFEQARANYPRELRQQPQTLDEYWRDARAYADVRSRYADIAAG